MLLHVISFALLMVLASVFIMLPVLLYVFDLRHQGWYWQHAALFAAMTASTDAVAVGAILKSGTPHPPPGPLKSSPWPPSRFFFG
jgi:NhaP-type Na+/H+ or K+/H+ antiporter